MALFKSNKNKSTSAAASPAQSPRTSIDAPHHQRPVVEGNTMTREQAIRLAMHNSEQKLPHHFSLLSILLVDHSVLF
ncbi:hypothetical protein BGX24_003606 [Mortierella sp. AD032]|nr:hypothetical protein BGX24_003606 [Mortierella sp. AD032]